MQRQLAKVLRARMTITHRERRRAPPAPASYINSGGSYLPANQQGGSGTACSHSRGNKTSESTTGVGKRRRREKEKEVGEEAASRICKLPSAARVCIRRRDEWSVRPQVRRPICLQRLGGKTARLSGAPRRRSARRHRTRHAPRSRTHAGATSERRKQAARKTAPARRNLPPAGAHPPLTN